MKICDSCRRVVQHAKRWLGGAEPVVMLALLLIVAGMWVFIVVADKVMEGDTQCFDEWAIRSLRQSDSLRQLEEYFKLVYPDSPDGESTRTKNVRQELHRLFEEGIGHKMPAIRHTTWTALNAVTEYVDHYRSTRGKTSMERASNRLDCVLVSDSESLVYQQRAFASGANGSTGVLTEWQRFVQNQVRLQGESLAGPKLVCIDLQPNSSMQAPERGDILNVGGFSDVVIAAFLNDDANRFVAEVEAVTL